MSFSYISDLTQPSLRQLFPKPSGMAVSYMRRDMEIFHLLIGHGSITYVWLYNCTAPMTTPAHIEEAAAFSNSSAPEDQGGSRSLVEIISIAIVLAILDILTILGNLLVCVTILTNRRLKTTTNYFILSLAVSDLLLGIVVLPFSTLNTVWPSWPLGAIFCNVFISSDVMLCTVSILNLFAISLERYIAVTSPLRYSKVLTFRRVMIILSGVWIFSFAMAFLPIHLGWNTNNGNIQNLHEPQFCMFESNKAYVLFVSIGTYFLPLLIMCLVYVKVFQIARDQVQRINSLVRSTARMFQSQPSKDPRFASDSKATVTLASVVTAFAICWIPYFVIFTARPFLSWPIDPHLDLFALWLGYVNSMLNPFLYAFHSTQFRKAFIRVLTRNNPQYNSTKTTEQYV